MEKFDVHFSMDEMKIQGPEVMRLTILNQTCGNCLILMRSVSDRRGEITFREQSKHSRPWQPLCLPTADKIDPTGDAIKQPHKSQYYFWRSHCASWASELKCTSYNPQEIMERKTNAFGS
ncbi:MAG: hypothetical protein CL912_08285 [Deltaproteobacteria bacterium]|nr:hypothetical protein [Deltaproteobacteria bacterium]